MTSDATIEATPSSHDRDRIVPGPAVPAERHARAMAALVLSELPVSLEERGVCDCTELTDRIRELAARTCTAYGLDYAQIAPQVITAVLDHLCSYFPGLEPDSAIKHLPRQDYCDLRKAWVVNNVTECLGEFKVALIAFLRRAAGDFTVGGGRPAA